MYDLKELDRFVPVTKDGLAFMTSSPRKVRLEVLASAPTKLFVSVGGEPHYIGKFEGYDVVTFAVPGVFSLRSDGGACKVYTPEMEKTAREAPEAVSFTRIATRRTRNPELELMMQKVQINVDRRIQQVASDLGLRHANERRVSEQRERQALERARAAEERAARQGGDGGEATAGAASADADGG